MLTTDECASAPTATRHRCGRPPRWRAACSRAAKSADRFPADPPDTKHPPASAGSPASRASTSSAWFSAYTAPAASSHDVAQMDDAATTVSNRRAVFVGAAGMNARWRGLSVDMHAGARTSVKSASTSSGGRPSAVIVCPARAASSAAGTGPSSGAGSSWSRSRA